MKHQVVEILTKKGRIYTYLKDKLPEAMQNCQVLREYEVEVPYERPNIEVDTPLWVWDDNSLKRKLACFSHLGASGRIYVFEDGKTSKVIGGTSGYQNYELVIKDK